MENTKDSAAMEPGTVLELGEQTTADTVLEEENSGEVDLLLKLSRPCEFEGKTYTELDLSGLENLTAGDLERAGKITRKMHKGLNPAVMEMTLEHSTVLAQMVTRLPFEFFKRLSAKDAVAMKGAVVGFLYSEDGAD